MRWLTTNKIVTVTAMAMSLYQMYTAGVRQLPAVQQRTVHLCFGLILTFLCFPLKKELKDKYPGICSAVDYLFTFCTVFIGAYVLTQYENLTLRQGSENVLDCIVATLGIILVIEATRRIMGLTMCVLVLLSLGYAVFGSYLPPIFGHGGYSYQRIVSQMFLGTEGILGVAVGVSATVIIIFLIFGSFLQQTGGSAAFSDLGFGLFGRFKGGAAKAAVAGSYLFGMMTGSQTANVAAVGTLTIPLMIRSGYKPIMAGAIEALSSVGSMMTPPVMGAAAFIIPEIIGGSYVDVMKAAVIPGLLYYTAVFTFIQVQANKLALTKIPKAELPKLSVIIKQCGHLFLPIFVLLYLLIVTGVSTKLAGFWTVVSLFVVSMFKKNTRMSFSKIVLALENGPKVALIVILSCASAGIIQGVISLTGLGLRFSELLIYMAGGNLFILLFLTMIASLVMGMPLPPVTAYLILAILAAPALIKLGVTPMAAHLFVFLFGTLGTITPPSAPCAFAAAGIARTDPLKTTSLTFLLSVPTFIVPYLFVYSPELLLEGSIFYIGFRIITAFIAISCISMSFMGFARFRLDIVERIVIFIGGISFIPQILLVNAFGFMVIGGLIWRQLIYPRIASRG